MVSLSDRSRSILWVIITAFFLYGSAWALRISRADWNITSIVGFGCLNEEICFARDNSDFLPDDPFVFASGGYDGQFYYYIAASMIGDNPAVLDFEPFRLSRIGYPILLFPAMLIGGRNFLIVWMSLLPFILHVIAGLLLFSSVERSSRSPFKALSVSLLFIINPISLESFLLDVSDDVALSFAVFAFVIPQRIENHILKWISMSVLMTMMLLSKETFLAYPLAIIASSLILFLARNSRKLSASDGEFSYVNYIIFNVTASGFSIIMLGVWWIAIGFAPWMAAQRGGVPLQGMIRYLVAPDALLSGRSLLIALFFIYLAVSGEYIGKAITSRNRLTDGQIIDVGGATFYGYFTSAFVILATSVLVSFATAEEYWANFANVARLFTPGILPLAASVAGLDKHIKGRMFFLGIFFAVFSAGLLLGDFRGAPFVPSAFFR